MQSTVRRSLICMAIITASSQVWAQSQPMVFRVNAAIEGWQNSGWTVGTGDNIMVLAQGGFAMDNSAYWGNWVGPDGVSGWHSDVGGAGWFVSSANQFSLVMRVGESGPIYGVGSNWIGQVSASGTLYFAVNDRKGGYGDNDGALIVTVVKPFVALIRNSTEQPGDVGGQYRLQQNYPNPFNPTTTIPFEMAQSSSVQLKVYSESGQLIRTVLDERVDAGTHTAYWDGRNDRGEMVAAGTYFCRILVNETQEVKKMLLLR
jgi:hypothetical protein